MSIRDTHHANTGRNYKLHVERVNCAQYFVVVRRQSLIVYPVLRLIR